MLDPIFSGRDRSPLNAGLHLLLHNKRLLLWSYLANMLTGLGMGLAYHAQVSSILDHSLAAQRIAGRLDLSYLVELAQHTSRNGAGVHSLFPLLAIVYVVVSFILAAGVYTVFSAGEKPTLAVVVRSGIDYFWRFVRLALFAALVSAPTLGVLFALRNVLLKHADKIYVERSFFFISTGTFLVVALVAVFLRLWFDIAEATVIRLGMEGDRRVRRSIFPAFRLLRRRCCYNYSSYFLVGALGWLGFSFFLWLWTIAVPPRMVVLAWLVGQLGIGCVLFARIWQRGLVTAIVFSAPASQPFLAASHPVVSTQVPLSAPDEEKPEDISGPAAATQAGPDAQAV
ncbi:MAG: hypothetical protein ACP5EP_01990 [Acidobacteriaceae bacterium]